MGNLLASFNAGVSGLHSAQTSLNTTSHNLANAQTTGYTRQQTVVTDSFYQKSYGAYGNLVPIGTGTVIEKTRQIRNTFLDEQYRAQLGRQSFYTENLMASRELEDMLGELHAEQFSTSISDLWTALQSLSESPGDIVSRDQLVSVATQFVQRSQVLQAELNTYQTSLNEEVQKQVDSINEIVGEIRELNFQIRKFEITGQPANDYRDKRNDYLDQLASIINFETHEEKDGTVTIFSEGAYLLDTENQYLLKTEYVGGAKPQKPEETDFDLTDPDGAADYAAALEKYNEDMKNYNNAKLLKPVWKSGGDFFLRKSLEYSTENKTDIGSLRGIMVARGNFAAKFTDVPQEPKKPEKKDFTGATADADYAAAMAEYNTAMVQYSEDLKVYNQGTGVSVVMQIQSQVDTLVHSIVTAVNNALSPLKEVTLDDGSKIRILDEEKALIGDDENETMGAELFTRRGTERFTKETVTINGVPQEVYRYNEEDPTDEYTLYTIGQLIVNLDVQKDPSMLPTKNSIQSGKYGSFAHEEWLKMADAIHETVGVMNPNSSTTYNVFGYYTQMVSELSTTGNIWYGIVSNQEITVTTAFNERQNVMGVSTDEELSNLIKFQQCYNASSRYITTIDEMLEYIIERLGG